MEKVETKPLALRKKKKRGECKGGLARQVLPREGSGPQSELAPHGDHCQGPPGSWQSSNLPKVSQSQTKKTWTSDLKVFTKNPDLTMTPTGVPGFLLINQNPEHSPPSLPRACFSLSCQPSWPAQLFSSSTLPSNALVRSGLYSRSTSAQACQMSPAPFSIIVNGRLWPVETNETQRAKIDTSDSQS